MAVPKQCDEAFLMVIKVISVPKKMVILMNKGRYLKGTYEQWQSTALNH